MRSITVLAALVLGLEAPLAAQLRATGAAVPAGLEAAYAMSNTVDSSGHGRTATFTNTITAPGKHAEGQLFAGGNGSSRMTVPPITLTAAFTVEAWVKINQLTALVVGTRTPRDTPVGWQAIIYKAHDIVWLCEQGGFILAGFTPQGVASVGVVSPTPITVNTFHHVALTYTGAALTLVIDGLQVASRAVSGMVQASTNPLEVGGSAIDGGGLAGVVDDVRIYSRGLTLAEINADLATPVDTAVEAVVSWDLEVMTRDGGPESTPIAIGNFPKSGALCDLMEAAAPATPVVNPTLARVTDPEHAGRECELVIESFILGLPVGTGYTSAARAKGATSTSGRSAASNPFDRVAVVKPPATPGDPVVK
jgi:concanavalin A-like lectin/glucanase superfamily protein